MTRNAAGRRAVAQAHKIAHAMTAPEAIARAATILAADRAVHQAASGADRAPDQLVVVRTAILAVIPEVILVAAEAQTLAVTNHSAISRDVHAVDRIQKIR